VQQLLFCLLAYAGVGTGTREVRADLGGQAKPSKGPADVL